MKEQMSPDIGLAIQLGELTLLERFEKTKTELNISRSDDLLALLLETITPLLKYTKQNCNGWNTKGWANSSSRPLFIDLPDHKKESDTESDEDHTGLETCARLRTFPFTWVPPVERTTQPTGPSARISTVGPRTHRVSETHTEDRVELMADSDVTSTSDNPQEDVKNTVELPQSDLDRSSSSISVNNQEVSEILGPKNSTISLHPLEEVEGGSITLNEAESRSSPPSAQPLTPSSASDTPMETASVAVEADSVVMEREKLVETPPLEAMRPPPPRLSVSITERQRLLTPAFYSPCPVTSDVTATPYNSVSLVTPVHSYNLSEITTFPCYDAAMATKECPLAHPPLLSTNNPPSSLINTSNSMPSLPGIAMLTAAQPFQPTATSISTQTDPPSNEQPAGTSPSHPSPAVKLEPVEMVTCVRPFTVPCPHCPRSHFSSPGDFSLHVAAHIRAGESHPRPGVVPQLYRCQPCGVAFQSSDLLLEHSRAVHPANEYVEGHKEKHDFKEEHEDDHVEDHVEAVQPRGKRPRTFSSSPSSPARQKPRKTAKWDVYTCSMCVRDLPTFPEYFRHVIRCPQTNGYCVTRCTICKINTRTNKRILLCHLITCHLRIKCSTCGVEVPWAEAAGHAVTHGEKLDINGLLYVSNIREFREYLNDFVTQFTPSEGWICSPGEFAWNIANARLAKSLATQPPSPGCDAFTMLSPDGVWSCECYYCEDTFHMPTSALRHHHAIHGSEKSRGAEEYLSFLDKMDNFSRPFRNKRKPLDALKPRKLGGKTGAGRGRGRGRGGARRSGTYKSKGLKAFRGKATHKKAHSPARPTARKSFTTSSLNFPSPETASSSSSFKHESPRSHGDKAKPSSSTYIQHLLKTVTHVTKPGETYSKTQSPLHNLQSTEFRSMTSRTESGDFALRCYFCDRVSGPEVIAIHHVRIHGRDKPLNEEEFERYKNFVNITIQYRNRLQNKALLFFKQEAEYVKYTATMKANKKRILIRCLYCPTTALKVDRMIDHVECQHGDMNYGKYIDVLRLVRDRLHLEMVRFTDFMVPKERAPSSPPVDMPLALSCGTSDDTIGDEDDVSDDGEEGDVADNNATTVEGGEGEIEIVSSPSRTGSQDTDDEIDTAVDQQPPSLPSPKISIVLPRRKYLHQYTSRRAIVKPIVAQNPPPLSPASQHSSSSSSVNQDPPSTSPSPPPRLPPPATPAPRETAYQVIPERLASQDPANLPNILPDPWPEGTLIECWFCRHLCATPSTLCGHLYRKHKDIKTQFMKEYKRVLNRQRTATST